MQVPDLQEIGLILVAPVIGSFLGVIIRRVPEGRSVVWTRSSCEGCGHALAAKELVPLFSWAVGRGRCRHCGQRLGWFYPAVECAALAVALIALAVHGVPRAWMDVLFGWWLLALAWIDVRTWLLPDVLSLPLILAGLAEAAIFDADDLLNRALGALVGYLLLRGVAFLYRAARGIEGLGAGDAKLLSAVGAWLGVMALPGVILGAAVSALVVAAAMAVSGHRMTARSALPFGPFIAASSWIIWLLG